MLIFQGHKLLLMEEAQTTTWDVSTGAGFQSSTYEQKDD